MSTDLPSGEKGLRPSPRLRSEDRRTAILAAAVRLCSEHGFHGVRTRDLAAEAGVSEALLFRHFPSKDDLIREVMRAQNLGERLEMAEAAALQMNPREALLQLARFFCGTAIHEGGRMRLIFYSTLELPELSREFYDQFASRLLRLEQRLFERAFAERGWDRDSHLAARSFHGTLIFHGLLANVFRTEPAPPDPERFARDLVQLYLPEEP